jgi:GNAT superfamily N-acetyltransferase
MMALSQERNEMPFSSVVTDFWSRIFTAGERLHTDGDFWLTVNAELSEDRRAMVLETVSGQVMAAVTPVLEKKLALVRHPVVSPDGFRQRLREAAVTLHGADYVFYFPDSDKQSLLGGEAGEIRQLTSDDRAAFTGFESAASEQDLDDAFVEVDHWAVFGAFEQGQLVSAASAYPWGGALLADLGVLTLPPFRGRGHARRVVRSISRHALDRGYEPQYRCQLDNQASVRLARGAGLASFGKWEVVSPTSADQAAP